MIHIQAVHLPPTSCSNSGSDPQGLPAAPHPPLQSREHAVRPKGERATIVIVRRLSHRTKFSGCLPRIPQAILTGPVFPEDTPPLLLPQGLMFEEVASVGGKLRIKGQTHQAFPGSVTDGSTEVTKEALAVRGLTSGIQTPGLATRLLQYNPLGLKNNSNAPHHSAAGLKEGKRPFPPRNSRYLRYSRSPSQMHGHGKWLIAETKGPPQKADPRLHHEHHYTTP